jgi:hypothetical protein
MRRRCHLREVYNCDVFLAVDHQVEFIEVTMDQTVFGKLHDQLY